MNTLQEVQSYLANGNLNEFCNKNIEELKAILNMVLENLADIIVSIRNVSIESSIGHQTNIAEFVGFMIGFLLWFDKTEEAVTLETEMALKYRTSGHYIDLITLASSTKVQMLGTL